MTRLHQKRPASSDPAAEDSLRLLDEPFVFTQRPVLTVHQFIDELHKRTPHWPDEGQLEAFHRADLLVPIYAIRADPKDLRFRANAQARTISREEIQGMLEYTSTRGFELVEEREIGDLSSPVADGYEPWRNHRRSYRGMPYRSRRYLYSYYQLLATPTIEHLWPYLRGRVGEVQRLRLSGPALSLAQAASSWVARMVGPLTILEPVYLPEILEQAKAPGLLNGFDELDRYRSQFDPVAALARVGWSAEMVLKTAEDLLARGSGMDPTPKLHDLIRLVHSSHWDQLVGKSRTAMDYRIAGEILLLFYEDLARAEAAQPLEPLTGRGWHPRHERLKTDRSDIDEVLSRFGVSPHPTVVAVVEGKTEALLIPRALDHLYEARWRSRIRLFDAHGVDTPLGALAAFAAVPIPIKSDRSVIPLARHPSRFVVLSDAEGSSLSQDQRERKRQRWIDRIHQALPAEMQEQIESSELDGLVQYRVWDEGGLDFERAHFTDAELADALLAIAPHGPPRRELIEKLADLRRRHVKLENAWHEWERPHPTKPALAGQLWPVLAQHIDRARSRDATKPVPLLTVVRELMQVGTQYPRHWRVVMQRRKT